MTGRSAAEDAAAVSSTVDPRESSVIEPGSPRATVHWIVGVLEWLPWVWLAGSVSVLTPLCGGVISLWRLGRGSRAIEHGEPARLFAQAKRELGIARRVTLLESPCRSVPMTWGIVRPRVLLPEEARQWSAQRVSAALRHELAHVKRRDCLTQLLSRLACAGYWYNPLIWLAHWRMMVLRERACDDRVLACGETGSDYAEHLLGIAAGARADRLAAMGGGIAMARRSNVERRLLSILDPKRCRRLLSHRGLVATLLVLAAIVVPVAMLQSETTFQPPAIKSDSGLKLELVSVRPNGADEVFTPDGRSLGKQPSYLLGRTTWDEDKMYRQFVFEGPVPEQRVRFTTFVDVKVAGTERPLGGASLIRGRLPGRAHHVLALQLDRRYDSEWGVSRPIDRIDVTLRYWRGPRSSAAYTFLGPFPKGRIVRPTNGAADTFRTVRYRPEWGTYLDLSTSRPFEHDRNRVLVYDQQGERRLTPSINGRSGSGGAQLELIVPDLRPDQIGAITFGEPPEALTFKNIAVHFSDHPHRTCAPWLDRVAAELDRPDLVEKFVEQGKDWTQAISSREQALRIAPLVRGGGVGELWQYLRRQEPTITEKGFAPPQPLARESRDLFMAWAEQQRLAVGAWQDEELYILGTAGVDLGLVMDWPEFVDPALTLLESGRRIERPSPLESLRYYEGPLTDTQLTRLTQLLQRTRDRHEFQSLLRLFERFHDDDAPKAMASLALETDAPWLWWELLSRVQATAYLTPEQRRSVRFRTRMILVQDPSWAPADRPELLEQAWGMLPAIVADPGMMVLDHDGWDQARQLANEHLPAAEATAAEVALLRELPTYQEHWSAVLEVTRSINRRHGLNLGAVGDRDGYEYEDKAKHDWRAVAQAVLDWADRPGDAPLAETADQAEEAEPSQPSPDTPSSSSGEARTNTLAVINAAFKDRITDPRFALRDALNQPIADARFRLRPLARRERPIPGATTWVGHTDADGCLVIDRAVTTDADSPPPSLEPTFDRPFFAQGQLRSDAYGIVSVRESLAGRAIEFPVVSRGSPADERAFHGEVVGSDGQPLAGVAVELDHVRLPGGSNIPLYGRSGVLTDENGRFAIYPNNVGHRLDGDRLLPPGSTSSLTIDPPNDELFPAVVRASNQQATRASFERPNLVMDGVRFEGLDGQTLDPRDIRWHVSIRFRGESRNAHRLTPDTDRFTADRVALMPGRYEASYNPATGDGYEFQPIHVTDKSPSELVFRPRPTVTYHDRVVDGVTDEPIGGAVVFAYSAISQPNLAMLTDADWRKIQVMPRRPELTSPGVEAIDELYHVLAVVRTDAEGRYEIEQGPGDDFHSIVAFARHKLPVATRTKRDEADADHRVALPATPLFPAAYAQVLPVLAPNRSAWSEPEWGFAEGANQPAWFDRFRDMTQARGQEYEYGGWLELNTPQRIFVPAGVEVTLGFLNSHSTPWLPATEGWDLRVDSAEIVELGELHFHRAAIIELDVVDRDGKPIEGVPIRWRTEGNSAWQVQSHTDAAGRVAIDVPPNRHGSLRVDLPRGSPEEPRVPFDAPDTGQSLAEPLRLTLNKAQIQAIRSAASD